MTGCDDVRHPSPEGIPERNAPEDAVPDHIARYAFASHWAPGKQVVEFCCGTGYGSSFLAGAGATKVIALDVSQDAITCARQHYGTQPIEFVCADATVPLSLSKSDLVVCFEGLEHVAAPDILLQNIANTLTPAGVALISTPNAASFPNGHSGNPYHLHEYTRQELEQLLGRHFTNIEMYFQWIYGDPYDFRWTPLSVLRVLFPVPLKHAMYRMLGGPRRPAGTPKADTAEPRADLAFRYRPLPATHLGLPGLRFAEPPLWVAVCRGPR